MVMKLKLPFRRDPTLPPQPALPPQSTNQEVVDSHQSSALSRLFDEIERILNDVQRGLQDLSEGDRGVDKDAAAAAAGSARGEERLSQRAFEAELAQCV